SGVRSCRGQGRHRARIPDPTGYHRAGMDPSPDQSIRSAPTLRARTLWLIGTGIGLLMFVRDWLDQLAAGERPRVWVTLVEELTGAWLAVLLVPLVVRLVRRFRPPARHRWLYLPLHAGGALAFGAAH